MKLSLDQCATIDKEMANVAAVEVEYFLAVETVKLSFLSNKCM